MQGKYEAAEEMNRQALEGREKLGKDHLDTLTSVYRLAFLLHQQQDTKLLRHSMKGQPADMHMCLVPSILLLWHAFSVAESTNERRGFRNLSSALISESDFHIFRGSAG
jgi:hypothetical protein